MTVYDPRVDVLAEASVGAALWAVMDEESRDVVRPSYRNLLARMDEVHAPKAPGMVVDGDLLTDCMRGALPRLMTDEWAYDVVAEALDNAVRAGITVLHGPELRHRVVGEGTNTGATT